MLDFLRHVKTDEHEAHHLHSGEKSSDKSDRSRTEWIFRVALQKKSLSTANIPGGMRSLVLLGISSAPSRKKIPAADEAHDQKQHGKKCEEHVERDGLRLR